jgi:hypothetical protein
MGFVVNVEKGIKPTPLTEEWLKLDLKKISFTEDRKQSIRYKISLKIDTSEIISLNLLHKTNYCRFNS